MQEQLVQQLIQLQKEQEKAKSGGGGGGGTSVTESAPASEPTASTAVDTPVLAVANEPTAPSEEVPAPEPELNLTAKISESNWKKYAPALYVLGGILVILLGVYAFFLWRKKGNNSDIE